MSISTTVKKVVTDQAYATLGATDLAVEQVRTTGDRISAAGAELAPAKVQARVKSAPADARTFVEKGYADLTDRGEKLAERIANQQSTKDLVNQAESTISMGKGFVTTVRNAVAEVERSAKATLTIGRNQAEKAAEGVADSVEVKTTDGKTTVSVDAKKAEKAVEDSAKATRTAAKRTSTTAKNASKKSSAAAKRTTTSARKTANASSKATKKAAEKVGD
ncbi:hypothetical protein GCM10027055_03060 [Janibacter alkaliphilus]|uniref:DNA-binding protein HU-beta n=1 Tax=Janibacter alkaliphilus TaxID=1069963 RepID=A0A852XEM8_9MICO|nr:hypothetical protein [Janibacter alkaliphilus]NYG36921.1 DNA-binding protein HU-beta [Janibacter alkaliphilus]